MIILEENFKWHLEAFASELFKYFILCWVGIHHIEKRVWGGCSVHFAWKIVCFSNNDISYI